MNRYALALLAIPALAYAMEQTENTNPIESDAFLITITNPDIIEKYRELVENKESIDSWWRHQHANRSLDELAKKQKQIKLFKQFAEVMERGEKKFSGTITHATPGRSLHYVRIKAQPPINIATFKAHYLANPFIYRIETGIDAASLLEQYQAKYPHLSEDEIVALIKNEFLLEQMEKEEKIETEIYNTLFGDKEGADTNKEHHD